MELITMGLIIFAAGLIQGLSGFGSAMLSMSLLPLVVDIKVAVPIVAVNSIIISAINYYSVRAHFAPRDFMPLLTGAIFGAPIGLLILNFMDPDIIKKILGTLIITYSLYCLFRKPVKTIKLNQTWGYITGLIAGIFGGSCAVNGPPVIIYLTVKYQDKHKIKSTIAGFFLAAGGINIFMFILNGLYTLSVCKYSLILAFFTILGVFVGNHYYDKIDHNSFKKIIYTFLFAIGIFLITENAIMRQ